VNAWAAQIPEIGAGLVVRRQHVIATEAAPNASPRPVYAQEYASPTVAARQLLPRQRRRRMVFGKGGGTLAYNNRITARLRSSGAPRATGPQPVAAHISGALGPVGRRGVERPDRLLAQRAAVLRAAARGAERTGLCRFSGDGVGPSRLAGEILAEMAADGGSAGLPGALRSVPNGLLHPSRSVTSVVVWCGRPLLARSAARTSAPSEPRRPAAGRPRSTGYDHKVPKRPLDALATVARSDQQRDRRRHSTSSATSTSSTAPRFTASSPTATAKAVREASGAVAQLAAEGRATQLAWDRRHAAEKIVALTTTGEIPALEKLRATFPPASSR